MKTCTLCTIPTHAISVQPPVFFKAVQELVARYCHKHTGRYKHWSSKLIQDHQSDSLLTLHRLLCRSLSRAHRFLESNRQHFTRHLRMRICVQLLFYAAASDGTLFPVHGDIDDFRVEYDYGHVSVFQLSNRCNGAHEFTDACCDHSYTRCHNFDM